MRTINILDICCGVGTLEAWGQSYNAAQDAHRVQVTSIDILPNIKGHRPTLVRDITAWDYESELSPGQFDIVHASPPCTEYSRAKTVGTRNLEKADSIAIAALNIIAYIDPVVWVIENPSSSMLRHREFMQGMPCVDASLCCYGKLYRKTTRFWTNLAHDIRLETCTPKTCWACINGKHIAQIGSDPKKRMRGGSRWVYGSMPLELVNELMTAAIATCCDGREACGAEMSPAVPA